MSNARVSVPALLLAVCLFGCTQREKVVEQQDRQPGNRPTTREADLPEVEGAIAPGTVLRFAWLSTGGDMLLLDPDSGETTTLALPDISDTDRQVSWSKSGSSLAYRNGVRIIVVYDLATGETWEVGAADLYMDGMFQLSPDGTRVAMVRHGKLVTWDRGEEATFEGTPRCTTPGWSEDSTRVAVGSMGRDETEDGGLWLAADGGRAQLLVAPRQTGWGATQRVMWSPDGKWVAWARGAGDGWTGDIAHSDGNAAKRDTIGSGPLEWFPDSSALLTTIHIEAAASATAIYRLEDYSLTPIGPEKWDSTANLSPGGEMVLAWGWNGEVLVLDTATGEETSWAEKALILQADWAPDGRIGALMKSREGLRVWIGTASGEGTFLASANTDVPEVARWIQLPADAAVLAD